ncbi:MAG: alpha/beta fold hydrolase [Micromonosporaceae bacterium]|nr:alpha/beta fold hydrolase [Micromonosporaceae bacterium]
MPTTALSTRQDRSLLVEHAGGIVEIAARVRPGRADGDLLLLLHGMGCTKESFDSAFDAAPLADLAICAFDFPGHGRSTGPLPEFTIDAYADVTASVVRELAPRRLFVVAHSMGGAVGLVAAADLPQLAGFVNIEGNLVGQDCGLVSRGAAERPLAEFVHREFPRFLATLQSSPEPALRAWAGWYAQADPAAFHQVASSLVEWSDSGKLRSLFRSLPGATAYLHGDDSGDLSYLLSTLDGIPVYPVPGSGHFPMVDNPLVLWRVVAEVLAGAGHERAAGRGPATIGR